MNVLKNIAYRYDYFSTSVSLRNSGSSIVVNLCTGLFSFILYILFIYLLVDTVRAILSLEKISSTETTKVWGFFLFRLVRIWSRVFRILLLGLDCKGKIYLHFSIYSLSKHLQYRRHRPVQVAIKSQLYLVREICGVKLIK